MGELPARRAVLEQRRCGQGGRGLSPRHRARARVRAAARGPGQGGVGQGRSRSGDLAVHGGRATLSVPRVRHRARGPLRGAGGAGTGRSAVRARPRRARPVRGQRREHRPRARALRRRPRRCSRRAGGRSRGVGAPAEHPRGGCARVGVVRERAVRAGRSVRRQGARARDAERVVHVPRGHDPAPPGQRRRRRDLLREALATNPNFSILYAQAAKDTLAKLEGAA